MSTRVFVTAGFTMPKVGKAHPMSKKDHEAADLLEAILSGLMALG